MAIPVCGHPARPFEVTVMHQARAFRFGSGIQTEDDAHHFAPVSTFLSRIKYP